jgi:cellulose synthase operon protein C
MTRKLNLRFLGYLLAAVAVIGVGSHFLHAYQVQRNAATLRQRAERAVAGDHFDEAIREYRRYLSLVPADGGAWADYGLVLKKTAKTAKERTTVLYVLERALRLQEDRDDIRRQIVQVAMDLGQSTDARHHLEKLLSTSPKDAELLDLLGRCFLIDGDYFQAAEYFEKAIKNDPAAIDSCVRLADLYLHQLNKAEQTVALMDNMVRTNHSARAYVARARYYRRGGVGPSAEGKELTLALLGAEVAVSLGGTGTGPDCLTAARAVFTGGPGRVPVTARDSNLLFKAGQDLAAARVLAPDDAEVFLESAELERSRGWLELAIGQARRGLEVHPQDVRLYKEVADLTVLAGRRSEALDYLRRGVKALPKESQLAFQLAELLTQEGQLEEAAALMPQLKKLKIDPAILDYLDGRRMVVQEEWLEASKTLESAYPELVRWPDLTRKSALLLGKCYEQLGDADQQYSAYRRVLTEDVHDPLWFTAAEGVARSLLALNKVDEALEAYRRLVPQAPAARLMVARLSIVRNLRLPEAQRHWEEVDQLLAEARRLLPQSAEAAILQAQALAARSRYDEANGLLTAVETELPDDVHLRVARAGVAEAQGKSASALAILDEAEKRFGDQVELRLARVRYYLRTEDRGEAMKLLRKLEEGVDRFSETERRSLESGLAEAYASLDKPAEARRLWEQLAQRKPNDLGVRIHLFDTALQTRDDEAAERLLVEIRRLEGEKGTLWRYSKAALLVNRAKPGNSQALEEARPLLLQVAARRPNWSRVPTCQAQMALREGRIDDAIRQYLKAIELGERSPAVLLDAIRLLRERHRDPEAYEVIRKLPEQTPLLKQLSNVIVDLSLNSKDTAAAEKLARQTVADNPGDYRAHLSLAHVHWARNDYQETEISLRQAVKLAKNKPEPWTALIVFLEKTGKREKAEEAFREARGNLPETENRLTYAYCYEVVGQPKQAEDLYRAALKSSPRDLDTLRAAAGFFLRGGQTAEAKRHLENIILLRQSSEETASAKRLLALVLLSEATPYHEKHKLLADLGLLEQNPDNQTVESPDDKRMRALVLASQGRRRDRVEAIRILEEVNQLQPLTASDQFFLAQLYQNLGNKAKVQTLLQTLLSNEGDNPQYVAYFARILLARNEPEEADTWVAKLEKLQPKAWQTVELKARLLHAQGKNTDAISLAVKFAEEKDAPLVAIANLLEQIEDKPKKAAEQMHKKLIDKVDKDKKPDASLLLAGFLGRGGRFTEALDECDRLRSQRPPERIIGLALAILYKTSAGKAERDRVESWIQEALQAAKDDAKRQAVLRQNLATLYNLQARFDESEKMYRRCLEENPRDVLAMNNLAWLLAAKRQNADEALSHIQRALDIAGPLSALLDTRALIYLAQGKSDLAVKELEDIVADNPTGPGFFRLAQAYYGANNKAVAQDNLRRALTTYSLKEMDLDPLERDKYKQLCAALGMQ